MKKLFLISLILIFSIGIKGVTRYISPSGNDTSGDGSTEYPYKTFEKACTVALPGDLVICKDGVYLPANTTWHTIINCKGTSGAYITFRSETKYGAIIDGTIGVEESGIGLAIAYGSEYLRFENFTIRDCDGDAVNINHEPNISSYIVISGCKIYDICRRDLVEDYGRNGLYIGKKQHHITVEKCLFYNIGRTGPDDYRLTKDHAVYTHSAETSGDVAYSNTFAYNVIFFNSGNAFNIGSNNDLIVNNVVAWSNENTVGSICFITNEGVGGDNTTVANNIFYQPPTDYPCVITTYSTPAGYTNWSVKNNIVYGGRMWYSSTSETVAAMDGGNYGLTDCENGEVNPLFVSAIRANAPTVDFSLQGGSAAIDHGVSVGQTTDFAGNPITGLPDIGAYEYDGEMATYYNVQASQNFQRNNCEAGYVGSIVAYVIAANTYSSIVSQQEADDLALADIAANGQAYANTNGTCTLITGVRALTSGGKVIVKDGHLLY